MGVTIGIDTGGTFTDLIGVDEGSDQLVITKTPSTPKQPVKALLQAVKTCGVSPDEIGSIKIGTTVATNSLLTRSGANVIYVTTEGFEDVPFIQRMNRKHHFSLEWTKPEPLVERQNCLGVRERLDFHGNVLTPLEHQAIECLADGIRSRLSQHDPGSVAVAVCLLFSYVNPDHELRIRSFLRDRFPEVPVSLSHEVAPIWREYERGSTSIADSYIKPIIQDYVQGIRGAFAAEGIGAPWLIMKSNGGTTTAASAEAVPIKLLLSGLAGGIIAGNYVGEQMDIGNLVTLDMGGTSCDVGLISEGKIGHSTNYEIEFGLPVAAPTIDLTTIGAGGGSIAWIDKGGLLRVGPQSAGAEPGPICYDSGGEEVTVTDANLVLGRLNPAYFLGGKISLNAEKAYQALERFGGRIGLDAYETAHSVIELANENMANAIRVLSIDRGLDPREYTLVAFGGAGPLHAVAIAEKMGMSTVLVPIYPGLTSAFGAMIGQPRVNVIWSKHFRSDAIDAEMVDQHFEDMVETVLTELEAEGTTGNPTAERSISMRYWGQNYEQDVEIPAGPVTGSVLNQTLDRFHQLHERFYGYSISGEVIELIRFNVEVTTDEPPPMLPAMTPSGTTIQETSRQVYFHNCGLTECRILRREELPAGFRASGPLVIEEIVSTTLVPPGSQVSVDSSGTLLITISESND